MRFYSRLPVPALPWERDPHAPVAFKRFARAVPAAGALLGAVAGLVLALGLAAGLGPWVAATLAVATLTLVTGGLHEDGLADTADGFGGGHTPERRLAIMQDSRLGTFGAVALVVAFTLRIAAITTLAERTGPVPAAAALVLAAALSRAATLIPLAALPPARTSGLGHGAGRLGRRATGHAILLGGGITLAVGAAAGLPLLGLVLAMAGALAAAAVLCGLARRLIGGQTGDVAGAAQQLAEIAALLALLIAVRA